jgi:hypothetical protein
MGLIMKTAFMIVVASALLITGCSSKDIPDQWASRPVLETQMQESIQYFRRQDPTIRRFLDDCNGLIVFTNAYKAPTPGGGVFGRGLAFEGGKLAGNATVSQQTADFTIPIDYFREIVFFRDKANFEDFKKHGLTFDSHAVGIALSEGVAAKSDYTNGMATFVMCDASPMDNISLAGQQFEYAPIQAPPF